MFFMPNGSRAGLIFGCGPLISDKQNRAGLSARVTYFSLLSV
jgi:hypothetical protein